MESTGDKNPRSASAGEENELYYETKIPLGDMKTRTLSAYGSLGNTFMIRLRPGTDLLTGIREVCEKHDIRSGVILCSIGSLQKGHLSYIKPAPESTFKAKYEYVHLSGPIEFCSGQGTISEMEDGKIVIHMHGVLSDRHGRCYCGEVAEGNNIVLANMEIVISEIENLKMPRKLDPEVGAQLLNPEERIATERHKQ